MNEKKVYEVALNFLFLDDMFSIGDCVDKKGSSESDYLHKEHNTLLPSAFVEDSKYFKLKAKRPLCKLTVLVKEKFKGTSFSGGDDFWEGLDKKIMDMLKPILANGIILLYTDNE